MFSESSSILQQRMPQYYLGQNYLILWVWVLFLKKKTGSVWYVKEGGGGVGGASLALIGCPSSDGVTIKMPYGIDVLHRPALHLIFSHWFG